LAGEFGMEFTENTEGNSKQVILLKKHFLARRKGKFGLSSNILR